MVKRKILRDYRRLGPTKFRARILDVRHGLTNNPNFPDSAWGSQVDVLGQCFEKIDRYDAAYRLADNGDRAMIRDRDKLAEEIIVLLDQIASFLEAVCVRNPDALFTTGFAISQERSPRSKTKLPLTASRDFMVVNMGEPGKALATASTVPGAFNHEIHVNMKDPSIEADWLHKAIFPDASHMLLENLEPGNTFLRMRHHGPNGPGPWSPTTNVTIT